MFRTCIRSSHFVCQKWDLCFRSYYKVSGSGASITSFSSIKESFIRMSLFCHKVVLSEVLFCFVDALGASSSYRTFRLGDIFSWCFLMPRKAISAGGSLHNLHLSIEIPLCPWDAVPREAAFHVKHWFHLSANSPFSPDLTFCLHLLARGCHSRCLSGKPIR